MSTVNAGWRGPNIVKEGLVLYLDASSGTSYSPYNSGTTWRDISGNNNSGSLTNGPTYTTASGSAIVFDGVDDYANFGTGTLLNITGSLTMCCWFKLNSTPSSTGNPNLIDRWDWPNNKRVSSLGTETGYFVTSISRDGTFTNRLFVTDTVLPTLGQFYFLTSTYDGQTLSMYKNTTLVSSSSYPTPYPLFNSPDVETWIGRSRDAGQGGRWISANMSVVQIYNRALSATEVLQNYNATKARFGL